jgi:hypothetical protein
MNLLSLVLFASSPACTITLGQIAFGFLSPRVCLELSSRSRSYDRTHLSMSYQPFFFLYNLEINITSIVLHEKLVADCSPMISDGETRECRVLQSG